MVHDHEVGVGRDGLVGDGLDRVDSQQDPAYVGVRVTADQTDGIPLLSAIRRVPGVHESDHIGEPHGRSVVVPSAQPSRQTRTCSTLAT